MRDYARICGGRVLEVVTTATSPAATQEHSWVDLARRRTRPQPGWRFDGERFSPPTIVRQEPPEKIAADDFRARFSEEEMDLAAQAALQYPAVLLLLLDLAGGDVRPRGPRMASGLEALVEVGVLSRERVGDLLK